MRSRGDRRHMTARKASSRDREFLAVCGYPNPRRGCSKNRSPFDCGNAQCGICRVRDRDRAIKAKRREACLAV